MHFCVHFRNDSVLLTHTKTFPRKQAALSFNALPVTQAATILCPIQACTDCQKIVYIYMLCLCASVPSIVPFIIAIFVSDIMRIYIYIYIYIYAHTHTYIYAYIERVVETQLDA
jgi:hypothetical protein